MKSVAANTCVRRGVTITLLAVLVSITASVARPDLGAAQSGGVPAVLAGTWALDGDPARAMRTVEAAFASSVAALPELIQGFARDRIRNSMRPPRRVVVTLDGSRVRVTLESERTTTVDGTLTSPARTVGVEDGTRVTPRLQGGWLELLYEGEASELHQLFSTEADGSRMHVDFHVVNARLAAPVRYRLDYVRSGAGGTAPR